MAFHNLKRAVVLLGATLIVNGICDPSESTQKACEEIAGAAPDLVSYPLSKPYDSELSSYWSTALREVKPACLVLPASSEDVAAAVKVLNKYPDVKFAVKSGGHDPNPRHSSIQDGVLIAMSEMIGTTYDAETKLAYVQPGGEWNDVVGSVDPEGATIVGGRLGIVGVGGYLLQGGISFLSTQYGLAADSIVGWETVVANGSIINVDAKENPDLAVAMRGSGSQFGIVTKFTIETHPIDQVWGGMRIYGGDKAEDIYKALHEFVPGNVEDPKAAVILSDITAVGGTKVLLLFYFYDGPEPPTTGSFANFLEIPSTLDTTSTQSYADLLKTNGEGADLLNSRVSFRTYTLPYVADAPQMYGEISDKFKNITTDYLSDPTHLTSQCSIDFQPFPSVIGKISQERGGNAMGITGDDADRVLLEIQCSWAEEGDDEILYGLSRDLTEWLKTKIPEWTGGEDAYLPLLMNDAAYDQNVTGTYRDYAKFKELQASMDPHGLFSRRGGGYTY